MMNFWQQAALETDEGRAWETLWRWRWFARDSRPSFRAEVGDYCQALAPLLEKHRPRTVHDASCGLGFKTIVLAEAGYRLSGSDPCAYATRTAAELARAEGHDIAFSLAGLEDLDAAAAGPHDCVHSDHFDQIEDRGALARAAGGVYRSLAPGGFFVFGALADDTREVLELSLEEEWRRQPRFVAFPAVRREGIVLRELHVYERKPDELLASRIYWIEAEGKPMRLETSYYLVGARWTVADYAAVFREAGFRGFETVDTGGTDPHRFHLAHK